MGESVRRFWAWWIGALSRLLTPRPPKARPWRALLLHRGQGFEIYRSSGGKAVHVASLEDATAPDQLAAAKRAAKSVRRRSRQTLIRLSPEDVLERTLQIPAAAEDVVEPVLDNQMDRIVPWPKPETRYAYEIEATPAGPRDQLQIRVVATRRSLLDQLVAQAGALGVKASAIDFAPPQSLQAGIELMSLRPDPARRTATLLTASLLTLAVASVGVGAYGLHDLWQRHLEQEALTARASAVRERLVVLEERAALNARLAAQRQRLITGKRDTPSVTVLVEALSRALPDSAYLTKLSISGSDVRIEGKANEPTALIPTIERTTQFANVEFSAPTTREEGNARDNFSITATAGAAPLGDRDP